jgi:hypothetical protein
MDYRTIDIDIDIFYPNHQIINRIVKFPLSHRLNSTYDSWRSAHQLAPASYVSASAVGAYARLRNEVQVV